MAVSMKDLGIDRLSVEERVSLAQEILDSVAADGAGSILTEAQRVELERRIQNEEAEMAGSAPWDQVESEILARISPK